MTGKQKYKIAIIIVKKLNYERNTVFTNGHILGIRKKRNWIEWSQTAFEKFQENLASHGDFSKNFV